MCTDRRRAQGTETSLGGISSLGDKWAIIIIIIFYSPRVILSPTSEIFNFEDFSKLTFFIPFHYFSSFFFPSSCFLSEIILRLWQKASELPLRERREAYFFILFFIIQLSERSLVNYRNIHSLAIFPWSKIQRKKSKWMKMPEKNCRIENTYARFVIWSFYFLPLLRIRSIRRIYVEKRKKS